MTGGQVAGAGWEEPGAEPVSPGVWRIPLPLPGDGLRAVNVYALAGPQGLTLVDGGWSLAGSRDLLVRSLAETGHTLADVTRFLVTHVHRDHYTQAVALRRETGAAVSLGEGERATLDLVGRPGRLPLEQQVSDLRRLGAAALAERVARFLGDQGDRADWAPPDDWLADGQQVRAGTLDLTVLATPGHTRGHVVFLAPAAGLLFAGDHVLPRITPSIGFEPVPSEDPLGSFLASLALLRARPDTVLLPAHGPVAPSVHARVDELLEHHRLRLEQTVSACLAGAGTAYEVAGQLRWTRRLRTLGELDDFNQMLAVSETGAHLTLLGAQGRLTSTTEDGVLTYR